jgi:excisionase family DNA binding protein
MVRTDVAAKRLGVHIETLYRWMRAGHVAYVRPGRRRKLIRESELQRLLEQRRATA